MSTRRPSRRQPATYDEAPQLVIPVADARERVQARIVEGRELLNVTVTNESDLQDAKRRYHTWDEYNRTLLERMFSSDRVVSQYRGIRSASMYPQPLSVEVQHLREDIERDIRKLESIDDQLELYVELTVGEVPLRRHAQEIGSAVFVVHGHDEGARESVARFLTALGLDGVILNEQAHLGETLIEKLERHRGVGYVVVLLTPDDVGGPKGRQFDELVARARQNVILELGFFIGALGRERVCTLYKPEIEMPTDFVGSGYIEMDAGNGWKIGLARELKAAGFDIDLNRAL